MKSILVVSNRPLNDIEAALYTMRGATAGVGIVVVKSKLGLERDKFLQDVGKIWYPYFEAL